MTAFLLDDEDIDDDLDEDDESEDDEDQDDDEAEDGDDEETETWQVSRVPDSPKVRALLDFGWRTA